MTSPQATLTIDSAQLQSTDKWLTMWLTMLAIEVKQDAHDVMDKLDRLILDKLTHSCPCDPPKCTWSFENLNFRIKLGSFESCKRTTIWVSVAEAKSEIQNGNSDAF